MKNHTKVYMQAFGFQIPEDVFCEICGRQAVDINHIEPRGMGGSKTKDYIENLQALCRPCHMKFEAKQISKEQAQEVHNRFMLIFPKAK